MPFLTESDRIGPNRNESDRIGPNPTVSDRFRSFPESSRHRPGGAWGRASPAEVMLALKRLRKGDWSGKRGGRRREESWGARPGRGAGNHLPTGAGQAGGREGPGGVSLTPPLTHPH